MVRKINIVDRKVNTVDRKQTEKTSVSIGVAESGCVDDWEHSCVKPAHVVGQHSFPGMFAHQETC